MNDGVFRTTIGEGNAKHPFFAGMRCSGFVFLLFTSILLASAPRQPIMAQAAASVPAVPAQDNHDASSSQPIPAEPVQDQRLEYRLNAVFSEIPDFASVRASVKEGVVRLSGRVDSLVDERKAEELARRLEGVVYVVSDINVEPEIDIRFAPMIGKARRLAERIAAFLPTVLLSLAVVAAFWLVARMIKRWDWLFQRLSRKRLMQNFLRQLISHLVVFVGILIGLYLLDLTAMFGAIIGAAGLIGLVLGLAFQDIAENYLAGFLLSTRSLFGVGDRIDVCDHEGKVVQMTMRELVLMTHEGNHVRIPNSEVFKNATVNYSRNPYRECNFTVNIDTAQDLDHVQEVGCAALGEMTGVVHDPGVFMRVEEFGPDGMVVRFHVWVDQRAYSFRKVRSEAKRVLKMALDEAGIKMPPPLREITIRKPGNWIKAVEERPRLSAAEAARRVDVSPEEHIKLQIEEEINRSI